MANKDLTYHAPWLVLQVPRLSALQDNSIYASTKHLIRRCETSKLRPTASQCCGLNDYAVTECDAFIREYLKSWQWLCKWRAAVSAGIVSVCLGWVKKERTNWRDLIFWGAKIKKRPVLNWVHSNTGRDQDLFGGYYINNELWPQYLV